MPLDIALLVLRVLIALSLYVFLGLLMRAIWQDLQFGSQQALEAQRPAGRLVVIESDEAVVEPGHEYLLQEVTTIGRGPGNSIILPDSSISVEHARIGRRLGQWWLEDRNSRNGTFLNEIPASEPVVLTDGDEIRIGRIRLRLHLE